MSSPRRPETTTLRIIGGQFRSRRLQLPVTASLRPTHDRIRETLFNWLGANAVGCVALDAFAGSGALGFEAMSRGANRCCFVEKDPALALAILDNAKRLGVEAQVTCVHEPWPQAQSLAMGPFDLVFLDPPFGCALLSDTWASLCACNALSPNAWVYVEQAVGDEWVVPEGFTLYRQKQTQRVQYALYRGH